MTQEFIESMTGYKATDKNMQCRGFQFELGKWYEHDGELKLCGSGFHFCDQPSGPWAYYSEEGTRIFKVEAEKVLKTDVDPGADFKRVCKRIRLVEEVKIDGTGNTGDRNTGDGNTGDSNTGNWNTGDGNTGDSNTGYRNIGNGNTGNWNTGDGNTGDRNTGNWNTGNWNTGCGNATDYSSGFFCSEQPKVICFDVQTNMTHDEFTDSYPEYWKLSNELTKSSEIDFEKYKRIPGITPEKLKALHEKHLDGRKGAK